MSGVCPPLPLRFATMKYSLRSLMIVAILAPPVLAGLCFVPVQTLAAIVIPLLTVLTVHVLMKSHSRQAP